MTLPANVLWVVYTLVISLVAGSGMPAVAWRIIDHRAEGASSMNLALLGQLVSRSPAGLANRAAVGPDPKAFVTAPGQKAPLGIGCANPYTVRPGDTLYTVAWRCGATVANLMRWNRLKSVAIRPGQRLIVRLTVAPNVQKPSPPAPQPTPRIEPRIRP